MTIEIRVQMVIFSTFLKERYVVIHRDLPWHRPAPGH
jgi:hypothetical protein